MSDAALTEVLRQLGELKARLARTEKMEFATGASLRTAGLTRFQRVLVSDFSLSSGEFLLAVKYIDLNGHDFIMQDGADCEVVFL